MRESNKLGEQENVKKVSELNELEKETLLSELHVHQIELELQNIELRESHARLEFVQRQYADLYNQAPVGYASLDDNGLIVRCNLTLAEMFLQTPDQITGRALVQFIDKADHGLFLGRYRAFTKSPGGKHIDVRFINKKINNPQESGFIGRIQGRLINQKPAAEAAWKETLLVVISDVTLIKKSEERVQHMAYHDALTGLPNRANLNEHITAALALASRQHHVGALLFMDMDRFKTVNDSLGHQIGDELLICFAERVSQNLRKENIFVRLGGDEFVILLAEQCHDRAHMANKAERVAKNLIEVLGEPFIVSGHQIQVTISLGISLFPNNINDTAVDVLRQADTAMYQAKANQLSAIEFFDLDMQEGAFRRRNIEGKLRLALELEHFVLHYQPQVTMHGDIVALEALVRWEDPEQGLIQPGQFIPVAEETGLIVELGDWVLRTAISQFGQWQAMGLCKPEMRVAVNVSALQLQNSNFAARVEHALKDAAVSAKCLVLEITESLLLPNDQRCYVQLQRLHQLGLTLSVDDFGMGYSSLSVLQQAPVRQLKIDRHFVLALDKELTDKNALSALAVVKLIIAMARELNMQLVAEGVETNQQLQLLSDLKCDEMQGFLFSKPVAAEQVAVLLSNGKIST